MLSWSVELYPPQLSMDKVPSKWNWRLTSNFHSRHRKRDCWPQSIISTSVKKVSSNTVLPRDPIDFGHEKHFHQCVQVCCVYRCCVPMICGYQRIRSWMSSIQSPLSLIIPVLLNPSRQVSSDHSLFLWSRLCVTVEMAEEYIENRPEYDRKALECISRTNVSREPLADDWSKVLVCAIISSVRVFFTFAKLRKIRPYRLAALQKPLE